MSGDEESRESGRVVELRRASLERAGFDPTSAADLAVQIDVPLQAALQLVKAGFPPDVAFEMLTSGERPVF